MTDQETIPLVTPGEILQEEFIAPNGITGKQLSEGSGVPASRISEIIHDRKRISAEIALRFAAYFGNTPQFWLNLQSFYDYERAELEKGDAIRREVHPLKIA